MRAKKKIAGLVASALLIFLFVYAAISKLIEFPIYYGEINSQPLPDWRTPFLAAGIPSVELVIAMGLISGKYRFASLWAAFILMSAFTVYIALILFNVFDRTPCSCGGVLHWLNWKEHFFLNLFFIAVSLAGIISCKTNSKPVNRSLNFIV